MGLLSVDLSVRDELKRSLPIAQRTGIEFPRYFTAKLEAGKTPYDEVSWELRTASIGNDKGSVIFEQRDVEVPVGLVADRHQYRRQQIFPRQAGLARARDQRGATRAARGRHHRRLGHDRTATSRPTQDGENFRFELAHLMLTQKACFNSPVWFNVGVKEARGYGWYLRRSEPTSSTSSSRARCGRSARPASSSR